jgi:hypothetical protein
VDGIQVDIIMVSPDLLDMGLSYFAWSDLGNLMGRTSRRMGFRYGHKGLSLQLPQGKRIPVSSEPRAIFSFLGYDFQRWQSGFDSLGEMFKFVATGEFFNPDSYLWHNLNHSTRVRNRKRKSYAMFLDWVGKWGGPKFDFSDTDDAQWEKRADCHFGTHWREARRSFFEEETRAKRRRRIFNGGLVAETTGLRGEALGRFMRAVREMSGGGLDLILDTAPPERVLQILGELGEDHPEEMARVALEGLRRGTGSGHIGVSSSRTNGHSGHHQS